MVAPMIPRLLSLVLVLGWFTTSMAADLRVMSFNLRFGTARDGENHWDNRREFVAETIAAYDPDLLGTQETLDFQKDFLAKTLERYTAIGVGRDDGTQTGEMTALFIKTDRFEILDQGHFWLSETPDVPGSISWDSSLTRMASWVRLQDKQSDAERPILFINTHFDHRGAEARKQSAILIRKMADRLGQGCDIILTGDFNAGFDTAPYREMFETAGVETASDQLRSFDFTDTYRAVRNADELQKATGEATFSGFRADVTEGARIDWIAVAGDWKVIDASIDRTSRDGRSPSDHYPVTTTLRQTSAQPRALRVLTYNIKRGLGNDNRSDLGRTADTISRLNVDVVALQEVDENTQRSDQTDQATFLGERLKMHHAFAPFMDYQGGRYGLAILSKHPIIKSETIVLPKGNEPRVALAVDVRLPTGKVFTVVNVHFDWVKDDSFRFAQAQTLRERLDTLDHPFLLMGDFNDVPESRTLKLLSERAKEADKPVEDPFTFSATQPKIEIDFIFGSPEKSWRFENVDVIEEPLTSDHRPVFAEAFLEK